MKLNLDKVTVWSDLGKTECRVVSLRKDFANGIYTKGAGLAAHALAIKMWNGDGTEDYSEGEIRIVKQVSELCQPSIIDAVNGMIDDARRDCLTNKKQ